MRGSNMIIAFGYEMYSGKTEAAKYLKNNYNFEILSFAAPLKQAAKVIYSLTDEQLYGGLKEEVDEFWKETPRQLMQTMATECMRKGHREDIWIQAAKRKMVDKKNYVIDDLRFMNETTMLKELNGFLVYIDADFRGRKKSKHTKHQSEIELEQFKEWDYVLENYSTLDEFYKKIDKMYQILSEKV